MSSLASAAMTAFSCPVFYPGDPGYAAEATGFNLIAPRSPQLVVGATCAADVADAVRFAQVHGLQVAVIGGGHGAASIEGGVLIATRRMQDVQIDAERQTATFGAGVPWRAVVDAALPHGLTPITGSCSQVGAVGYLLGGGTSPLGRSHGYSVDYVESITIVTGAGELVEASATRNPELFWALRGGKAGLGVVTEVTMRLVKLSQIYAGSLAFAEEHIEAVVRGWIDWTRTADEQVTTSFITISFPDMDGMPPPYRGKRISFLRFAYPGEIARGIELAAPLRALAPMLNDDIGPLAVDQLDRIHNDPTTAMAAWEAGAQLRELDGAFADAWLAHFGAGTQSPLGMAELRQNGGRQRVQPPDGDATEDRQAGFTLHLICVAPPLFAEAAPEAARTVLQDLSAWTLPVANVNFIGNNPFATPWPPDVLTRIEAARRSVDPAGIFAIAW